MSHFCYFKIFHASCSGAFGVILLGQALSLVLVLSSSVMMLVPLIQQAQARLEISKAKRVWLENNHFSKERYTQHLICENSQLKFCFSDNRCGSIFTDSITCQYEVDDRSIDLELSYGRKQFFFNFISDHDDFADSSHHKSYRYVDEFVAKF